MNYYFAPVQGHTDAAYRHFHAQCYGNHTLYYTPFMRLEHNELRQRDVKDFSSELNNGIKVIPQIIFNGKEELVSLVKLVKELGAHEIDLNMGCPFPLQTGKGRGAATIANEDLAKDVVEVIKSNPDISFSVKMRLGYTDDSEWNNLICYLNDVKLVHVCVHPRIAKQQYGGEVNLVQFGKLLKACSNKVVYNGDLVTPDDIRKVETEFPEIEGVMIGRGLLARPSLVAEYLAGEEMPPEERIRLMLGFHRKLLAHYSSSLCGDSQIISKIKPFWEYAENEIGRKSYKAIKKAVNIAKYHSAVATVDNN